MKTLKKTFEEFKPFLNFKQEILREIVRDAETEMQARLTTANAADQRALTLAGFQVASTTAIIGGTVALLLAREREIYLISVGIFQIVMLLIATFKAVDSVRPKLFSFPGNRPDAWFLQDWHFSIQSEKEATITKALVEQCYILNKALIDNKNDMEVNAKSIKLSIDITFWSIFMSAILIFAYVIWKIVH